MRNNSAALLRVLAATLSGRAAISLGTISTGHVSALLAGLDITSRLIVASGDDGQIQVLNADVPEDLRLSVHAQPLAGFLDDIAAHRFGLVLITEEGMPVFARALDMLDVGGIVIGLGAIGPFPADSRFESAALELDDLRWLATRRQHARPSRRKRRSRSHS